MSDEEQKTTGDTRLAPLEREVRRETRCKFSCPAHGQYYEGPVPVAAWGCPICAHDWSALIDKADLMETFICEHGGLINEWAKDWEPTGMTLRDHMKRKLDQWIEEQNA